MNKNIEIVKAVGQAARESAEKFGTYTALDKTLGYDPTNDSIKIDLRTFASEAPTEVVNEFAAVLVNKIVVQRFFESLRAWENPFAFMMKSSALLGDIEEIIGVDAADTGDYSKTSTVGTVYEPDIMHAYIYTTFKKKYMTSVSIAVLRGAFVSEGGLDAVVAGCLGRLEKDRNLFIYDTVLAKLPVAITTDAPVITAITDVGQTENAQKSYEAIMSLANKMTQPSTLYNAAGVREATPKGKLVLVINSAYKASFDINVMASLLNSKNIGQDQYFSKIVVAELTSGDTNLGYIFDEEFMMILPRLRSTDSFYDSSNMITTYHLHDWGKVGSCNWYNAVALTAVGA